MNPTFSILHATYGRPHKAIMAMEQWFARAARPQDVEYIFALNYDDPQNHEFMTSLPQNRKVLTVHDFFKGSAPAWDAAARASTGLILIQAADDLVPSEGWDTELIQTFDSTEKPVSHPTVIAVSDGYRKDDLMTVAICNRARYEQVGEFLHSGYVSLFSDDDFSYRALKDARDKKCTVINARDIVFRHEHPAHNPAVPMDPTYARGSSSEAYRIGSELFFKRNPDAHKDGLRTWQ